LAVEGIDGPPSGESQANGPDGEYRGILHRLPARVEDAPTYSSPLLQLFGIEFASLGDERFERLARFGVDNFAENLDRLRQRRRSIVLRTDRRLGWNSRRPETGQDEGHRRGAP